MDPITAEILKIGISETATVVFKNILSKNWIDEYKKGKSIVEQFTSSEVHSDYVVKHVSRAMKMRTIHSSENDVMLNDIYHPLIISHDDKEIRVGDDFLLSDSNITNIIGFAGQGKSTILRKILLESIKVGEKIPFFMELRKIEKNGIVNSLLKTLNELGISTNEDNLTALLKSDNVVLLLDGFDEISSNMREKILEEIIFLNRNHNLQIITTSRDGTEICTESGIFNYRVRRIKRSDILSILKKLSLSREIEKDTLTQIFSMLKGNNTLVETMNSPLLVTLFYICYPHLDSIPNSAIEFYSKLFTTLYFRHDKIKNYKRERKSSITPSEAFNSFCALCFKSLYDNRQDFTHQSILEYTKQSLSLCGIEGCRSEDMAYDFIDITCLIQKDGYDRYVFLHKSIQEYHAAEYVKSLSLDKKSIFMSAILKNIKSDSKMSATARYLYEIDKENTFNLLCKPLCEDFKIDIYPDDKDLFIKNIYNELTRDVKISLNKIPDTNSVKHNDEEKSELFEKHISSIGPFKSFMKSLSIFTRYYEGERTNPYNDVMIEEILHTRYTYEIFSGKYKIYEEENPIIDENGEKQEPYYILIPEIIDKLGRRNHIENKIRKVTDNIYTDAYKENIVLMERKKDALKEILGF
ncbi:NACHT domain-containing protein [Pectobacterium aroidearum]|uniref:NACHT domain-containing protein n=1 Tax=Pectobacterium aroidearum TaxID=1201031 RepID=UPI0015DEA917|nr:NACHT domain-containing protein [Pectobacterium aroidearum]MBA0203911.1 NACHT domain-containing protein [Pectobacterium aroidearum]